ncbi:MAG: hypothetical protein NC336_02205 [Clostridium sp.]|nr:hypothetical protein [Clostridium sp.]
MSELRVITLNLITLATLLFGVMTSGQTLNIITVPNTNEENISSPSPNTGNLLDKCETSVSYSSGTVGIEEKLVSWNVGDYELSVSVDYYTTGIKTTMCSGSVGLGWILKAGGVISREVVGLPDELVGNEDRFLSEESQPTLDYLKDGLYNNSDTGYDRFRYSFDGYHGSFFIIDRKVRMMPENGLQIDLINRTQDGGFDFRITTLGGTEYYFTYREIHKRHVDTSGDIPKYPEYYNYEFISSWHLTKITIPQSADEIFFHYQALPNHVGSKHNAVVPVIKSTGTQINPQATTATGATITTEYENEPILTQIESRTGKVILDWVIKDSLEIANAEDASILMSRANLSKLTLYNHAERKISETLLTYQDIDGCREFLSSVEHRSDGTTIAKRDFGYNDLPYIWLTDCDFWGFPSKRRLSDSSSILGANCCWNSSVQADTLHLYDGMLCRITDMAGITTRFEYEPSKHTEAIPNENSPKSARGSISTGISGIEFNGFKEGEIFEIQDDVRWVGSSWKLPVVIGPRIKRITTTDAVSGQTCWRNFKYRRSCPSIDYSQLMSWAFYALTGGVRLFSFGELSTAASTDVPFTSDIKYACDRSLALLNGARIPGVSPSEGRIYYGAVLEEMGGTAIEDTIQTIYQYNIEPAVNSWTHIDLQTRINQTTGLPRYVNIPENITGSDRDDALKNLFEGASLVDGYYQENLNGSPLLIREERLIKKGLEYRSENVTEYHYRQVRTDSVRTSIFIEPTIFAQISATSPAKMEYNFTDITDFNYIDVTAKATTWRCDTTRIITTGSNEVDQEISVVADYYDFEIGTTLKTLQSIFGDSIVDAPSLPLIRTLKVSCGTDRTTRHFIYGSNVKNGSWYKEHKPLPGLPIASSQEESGRTWVNHNHYGIFTLADSRKAMLKTDESFGLPDKKTSILHYNSYSEHGHITSVGRDLKNPTIYYWNDPYDRNLQYDGDCATKIGTRGIDWYTYYSHIPLIGPTAVMHPSGRNEHYYYDKGRLSKIENTDNNPVARIEYILYNNGENIANCIRTILVGDNNAECFREEYLDGNGETMYEIARGYGGDGNDVVLNAISRDALGRPVNLYRPYQGNKLPSETDNIEPTSIFYNGSSTYDCDITQPDENRVEHPAKHRRRFNSSSNSLYNCLTSVATGLSDNPIRLTNAVEGQYAIDEETDEDGHIVMSFYDFRSRKVLDRKSDGTKHIDTYYVYNDVGQLQYVLPPSLTSTFNSSADSDGHIDISADALSYYCYVYTYNDSLLMTSKKLPGCDPTTYIYDAARNLVLSQDGEQRKRNEMTFRVYNHAGAPTVTGLCDNADISWMASAGSWAMSEYRGNRPINRGNTDSCGYLWQPILQNVRLLKVNYYDDYDFLNTPRFRDLKANSGTIPSGRRSLLTGTLVAILDADGPTGEYETSMICYDSEDRPIRKMTCSYDGAVSEFLSEYSIDGNITKYTTNVTRGNGSTTEAVYTGYDHYCRPISRKISVNGNAPIDLEWNHYDALGRVEKSVVSNEDPVYYNYNEDGTLREIWSTPFEQSLQYTSGSDNPCYNGNISRTSWRVGSFRQAYNYVYDGYNRLVKAVSYNDGTPRNYSTEYSYDESSNITRIMRYGPVATGRFGVVDDLTMNYDGNFLTKITDDAENVTLENSSDFVDGADSETELEYDSNGNLVRDLNQNITAIKYNVIGLPSEIYINNIKRYGFTYDAEGHLLETEEIKDIQPVYTPLTPLAGSAFQVWPPYRPLLRLPERRRYIGNQLWSDDSCERLEYNVGYFKNDTIYAYCRDVQGNIRGVVADGRICQATHYYPFGLPWAEGISSPENRRKYLSKELYTSYGINIYNLETRLYEPQKCRFTAPDILAELSRDVSPYAYCSGNPILYSDPTGLYESYGDAVADLYSRYNESLKPGYSADYFIHLDRASGEYFISLDGSMKSLYYLGSTLSRYFGSGYKVSVVGTISSSAGFGNGMKQSLLEYATNGGKSTGGLNGYMNYTKWMGRVFAGLTIASTLCDGVKYYKDGGQDTRVYAKYALDVTLCLLTAAASGPAAPIMLGISLVYMLTDIYTDGFGLDYNTQKR